MKYLKMLLIEYPKSLLDGVRATRQLIMLLGGLFLLGLPAYLVLKTFVRAIEIVVGMLIDSF